MLPLSNTPCITEFKVELTSKAEVEDVKLLTLPPGTFAMKAKPKVKAKDEVKVEVGDANILTMLLGTFVMKAKPRVIPKEKL